MKDVLIIAGPTAVGKTEYAIELAKKVDGEIVSADSMQIYQYMNIGSAKPTVEELSQIPHHLVGEISPHERFTVYDYQCRAREHIHDIMERGKVPVVSGGTGLYISSIIYDMNFAGEAVDLDYRRKLEELAEEKGSAYLHEMLMEMDKDAAERLHPNNVRKVIRAIESIKLSGTKVEKFENARKPVTEYTYSLIGLTRERKELYERIEKRVDIMFSMGLIEEVQGLLDMGLQESDISMKGIGYKEVIAYLRGDKSLEDTISLVKKNTRHYAKKQLTWLRGYDSLHWIDLTNYQAKEEALEDLYAWVMRTD